MVITAKREVSERLFSQTGSEYKRLFNAATDPLLLQRSVLILRRVDSILDHISEDATGVELGVAVHGRLVIAQLALKRIGQDSLKNPDWDVETAFAQLVEPVLRTHDDDCGSLPRELLSRERVQEQDTHR